MPNTTMTQVQISNNSLAYTDQGQGPVVVLLHGLFGSSGNLGQTANDLVADHRVISLDLPGHGLSAWLEDYAHESMASAILNTLSSLDLNAFQLIGHSLGGKIGMQLASQLAGQSAGQTTSQTSAIPASHSSGDVLTGASSLRLEKLVIVDIAPRDYPAHHDDVFAGLNAVPSNADIDRREADSILEPFIKDAGIRAFLLKSFRRNNEGHRAWQFDVEGLQAQYSKLALSPKFPHQILCPTLFIKGANSDYLLPIDEAPIKKAFALPEFKIIHGTGHWPHAEKPAAFNSLVRRFLTRATNA